MIIFLSFSLDSYLKRPKNPEKHMAHFQAQLSSLEKLLMKTQDLVTVRGKGGSPVPIIIPKDVKHILEMLIDVDLRPSWGIKKKNIYIFANWGKLLSNMAFPIVQGTLDFSCKGLTCDFKFDEKL